eukprot:s376_g3.t1
MLSWLLFFLVIMIVVRSKSVQLACTLSPAGADQWTLSFIFDALVPCEVLVHVGRGCSLEVRKVSRHKTDIFEAMDVASGVQLYLGWACQIILLLLLAPLWLPACLVFLGCTLTWSLIFNLRKAKYELKITKEVLPPDAKSATVTTPDGVELRYCTAVIRNEGGGVPPKDAEKVVIFCNPLGQKGFASWGSVIASIAQAWGPGTLLVCWDYRGFFESQDPKRLRTVDVRNHAEDAAVVLREVIGDRPADLLVGHSMGVQVGLEFALLFPDKVGSLILLNGTYGQALQTGFQPVLRLPYVGGLLSSVIFWLLEQGHEQILESMRICLNPFIGLFFRLLTLLFGSRALAEFYGKDYMHQVWDHYLGGICSNTKSMKAFLRGFQVLDAHSTGHLLHELGHPTLLIAGIWDFLTPAYNMVTMNRAMRNARLVVDTLSGHFTCLEHPELAMAEVNDFLTFEVPHFKRLSTFDFEMHAKQM